MKIEITIDPKAIALLERLAKFPGQEIAAAMDLQNELTIGHTVQTRLTGRGPYPAEDHKLGVRTGLLRRSLRSSKATVSGQSVVSSIGTNRKYAGIHEFGFSGSVNVKAHQRGGKPVKAHARKVNMPARAPIQHGIEDRRAQYGDAISQAIIQAWGARQ